MKKELTYKKAGVDIAEGERFVARIAPMAKRTFRKEVLTGLGSFGALFNLDLKNYRNPVLVSGTDGVGTKLRIAFMMNRHDTVGIDLVAMCVNDILTSGAEPLFFLDYFATGKLRSRDGTAVIRGIVKGCKESGCSLIGGETAEMPGFYREDEYDLSGFAVGIVDKDKLIDGSRIKAGDVLIGISSSGLHSNGYSLVRKVFFGKKKTGIDTYIPLLKTTLGKELLKPTKIYVKAFKSLRNRVSVRGMAHITGGGLPGNLPRILPPGVRAHIKDGSWPVQPIFRLIQEAGSITETEMRNTFNMGIGYIMVVSKSQGEKTVSLLKKTGYKAFIIGNTEEGGKSVRYS
ncbi:MAG: phosphoribosylformylglycinamidine cyclo-ligase [Thermodesulfovibrionales bacterium]|nr:phosphoribosylformylglycinamidine cyclo-ligase [Thermodesulfovibrionales bacterium]